MGPTPRFLTFPIAPGARARPSNIVFERTDSRWVPTSIGIMKHTTLRVMSSRGVFAGRGSVCLLRIGNDEVKYGACQGGARNECAGPSK